MWGGFVPFMLWAKCVVVVIVGVAVVVGAM